MNFLQQIKEAYTKMQHPMIEVDGEQRHQHNSLGQPIHHTEEGIRNFHKWFGKDSTYVDDYGRPKVAYHGTQANIDSFRRSKYGFTGPGVYFGDHPDVANSYAGDTETGANVIPVYIRGKVIPHMEYSNNYIHKFGWGASEEHARKDGISGVYDERHENAINVFDPTNVKSAIGNNGSFNHPLNIAESREPIMETPLYDKGLTRDVYQGSSIATTLFNIERNHSISKKLGNDHYSSNFNGDSNYYHKNKNGKIDALSIVSDGVHQHMHKDVGVSSDIVKQNFMNALNEHDSITSDEIHSKGSRNFWFNLHTTFPGHKISMIDSNGNETSLSKSDMTLNEKKIWDSNDSQHIRLKIYAKK